MCVYVTAEKNKQAHYNTYKPWKLRASFKWLGRQGSLSSPNLTALTGHSDSFDGSKSLFPTRMLITVIGFPLEGF